ncbi:hypothetical protein RSSM_00990 [Rhodopirellula sallentina SM41]|uniref:Uncharacterized protein n=1 Tax=Rhodopirellula sallentina SM41 TaxID=1263870 RepID=M5U8F9_9BACT|nr:hypothetical protein RSSM_00990 [Rhodopirellula sallentina SM41]
MFLPAKFISLYAIENVGVTNPRSEAAEDYLAVRSANVRSFWRSFLEQASTQACRCRVSFHVDLLLANRVACVRASILVRGFTVSIASRSVARLCFIGFIIQFGLIDVSYSRT